MVKISEIIINYQENPVGIQEIEQIGWKIQSDERNVFQTEYELQVAQDAEFKQLVYESGNIKTDNSVHIKAKIVNEKLESSKKYYIRVKINTTSGETEWAEGYFVTALLSSNEWQAEFITIENGADCAESRGTYLRKEISIRKPVKSAYAYTTALGLYHFYVNGLRVGVDEFTPGWTSYNKHLLYQVYDITDLLQAGTNTLGSMAGAGWYKGDMGFVRLRNHYGKYTAFACHAVIEYEDGTKERFCTDRTWKGAHGPVTFSEIYDGEVYDARLEIPNWNKNGCNDTTWSEVSEIVFNKTVLMPQSGAKVRQMTSIPAKQIFKTPQGDTVIDFGQNLTGWIEFNVKGSEGAKAELHCFEMLDADGNVYVDNLRSAKATVTYICKDDREVKFHENFSFQGFQYAKVSSWPEEPKKENFIAYAVHSEMKTTGTFECSNPDINQLHHNIVWGMKGNFLDIPTDCPQRDERLGWTGDVQIFCRTATYLMDTYTFFRKWLVDLEVDQTEEGGVPHVVPDILIGKSAQDPVMKDGDHSAAAWADVSVILPWTLYLMYGDSRIIEKQYNSMKLWIEYMRKHAVNNIWNYKLQFGDWVALDAEEGSFFGATPNDLTCTAYYAYSTSLFAKMAKVIGKVEDVREYEDLYEQIKKTYHETFFENGRLNVGTQTAHIVSLYFNLVPEACRENVVDDLLGLLKRENGHLVTGFIGTPYFCHALSQNGHIKEAYDLLLREDFPSWLYQVKQGATTVWEHWDGKKPDGSMWSPYMNSFNHYAYGSVAEWIYRVVAGIEISEDNPGFKETIVAPQIGGNLDYVKSSYESVYGMIRSDWSVQGNVLTLDIEIPCNTQAVICPYGASALVEMDGVKIKEKASSINVGSGKYHLVYRI